MIFNSNEGKKKKEGKIKRDDFILFIYFLNSNEDNGANLGSF